MSKLTPLQDELMDVLAAVVSMLLTQTIATSPDDVNLVRQELEKRAELFKEQRDNADAHQA